MKINELVEALGPLAGWHVHAVSNKIGEDTFPCYTVRRLERHERESKANVILTSTEEPIFDRIPGLAFLAKDTIRVDWIGGRAWLEQKKGQLGYIQRVAPIEANSDGVLPAGVVARGKPELEEETG